MTVTELEGRFDCGPMNSSIEKEQISNSQNNDDSTELTIDLNSYDNIISNESSSTEDAVKMYLKEIARQSF